MLALWQRQPQGRAWPPAPPAPGICAHRGCVSHTNTQNFSLKLMTVSTAQAGPLIWKRHFATRLPNPPHAGRALQPAAPQELGPCCPSALGPNATALARHTERAVAGWQRVGAGPAAGHLAAPDESAATMLRWTGKELSPGEGLGFASEWVEHTPNPGCTFCKLASTQPICSCQGPFSSAPAWCRRGVGRLGKTT